MRRGPLPARRGDSGSHRHQRPGVRVAVPAGNEALILLAISQGLVRPCFSDAILAEYAAVLARPKFAFTPALLEPLLATLRDRGEHFQPTGSATTSPDPSDTMFLHCAQAAGAEFIVTGNKRDFPDAPYGAIRVVGAGELLDRITAEL